MRDAGLRVLPVVRPRRRMHRAHRQAVAGVRGRAPHLSLGTWVNHPMRRGSTQMVRAAGIRGFVRCGPPHATLGTGVGHRRHWPHRSGLRPHHLGSGRTQMPRPARIVHLMAAAGRDRAGRTFGLVFLRVVQSAKPHAGAQIARRAREHGAVRRRRPPLRLGRRRLRSDCLSRRTHSAARIASASPVGSVRRSLAYSRCSAGVRSSRPIGPSAGAIAAAASTALRTPPPDRSQ